MLPPGHIAAGFLTAKALLHFTHPTLSQAQQTKLLWWGMVFGFLPDLDSFIAFAQEKALFVKNQSNNHRKLLTHAPLPWLVIGLLIYFFGTSEYIKYIGLLVWLGSWSHFVLDTIQYGIMWFWPFSKRIYAFKDKEINFGIQNTGFASYWWEFVKIYSKQISFYLEILIIIISIVVFLR